MTDKPIPAVLLLADGTVAHGQAFGAIGTTTGEICFNTGMTGYQEVFTDPSYFGQILIMNAAHIGNYCVGEFLTDSSFRGISSESIFIKESPGIKNLEWKHTMDLICDCADKVYNTSGF